MSEMTETEPPRRRVLPEVIASIAGACVGARANEIRLSHLPNGHNPDQNMLIETYEQQFSVIQGLLTDAQGQPQTTRAFLEQEQAETQSRVSALIAKQPPDVVNIKEFSIFTGFIVMGGLAAAGLTLAVRQRWAKFKQMRSVA